MESGYQRATGGPPLWQICQDLVHRRAVVRLLANVGPENTAVAVDHKYRRRRQPVPQEVMDPICRGRFVVGIGEHRKGCMHGLLCARDRLDGVHCHRHDLDTTCLELTVSVLQLPELRPVGPSAALLEKDEHDRPLGELAGEGQPSPASLAQAEIRRLGGGGLRRGSGRRR